MQCGAVIPPVIFSKGGALTSMGWPQGPKHPQGTKHAPWLVSALASD